MIIHECEQGSEEWHALRAGIPTASEASKLVSATGLLSKSIEPYSWKLAAEIYSPDPENFSNRYMDKGRENEPVARAIYSLDYGPVDLCGFITTDDGLFGYSPDFLVGEDGLGEIKCLKRSVFLKVLNGGKTPVNYISQIQSGLWVTGRQWCDFVAHTEGLPEFVDRVFPDLEFHKKLVLQVKKVIELRDLFLTEKLGYKNE
jgi:hypothetical protein